MQDLLNGGLIDRLFGKSNLIFAMHEQLVRFAIELYTKLNILNEYRVNEGEFVELFLESLTKQIGTNDIKFIDFNKINEELSTYDMEDKDNKVSKFF